MCLCPLARFRILSFFARTRRTPRFVLWLTITMTPRCPQVPSALGSSERSLLQSGMSIIAEKPARRLAPFIFADRPFRRGFINQFFSIRQPGITVTANVAQLLAFPAGKLLEAILPSRQFTTFGHTWTLNPGRFNPKEHMVITIMANVGFTTPYTSNVCLPVTFHRTPACNRKPADHLGPVPATILQSVLGFQLRVPECVPPRLC